MKILIVDDSETSRLITRKCLHICGLEEAEYLEAADGLEALQVIDKNPVDLVVTDLNMPRMDGFTLVKKLKLAPRDSRPQIIVFSSLASEPVENELKNLGVSAVVHKPLTPEKLSQALEAVHAG